MIKTKRAVVLILGALVVFSLMKTKSVVEKKQTTTPEVSLATLPERKVIDRNRKWVDRNPASAGYVNQPSPDWEKRLEASLKEQAGNSLKDIKIKTENSLVWMRDENPLLVESVIITLTNHKKMESTFRALVDSQSGKVLESWDRTITDPGQIKEEGFKIKLDPRYTN